MAEAKELTQIEMFEPFSKSQLEEVAKITEKKTFKRYAHI